MGKSQGIHIIWSILLITSLISSSWMTAGIYADFMFRKDYIIKNICINRTNPSLKCEGKCYLMTKIKEHTTRSIKSQTNQVVSLIEMTINFLPLFSTSSELTLIPHQIWYQWCSGDHKLRTLNNIIPPTPPPQFL